MTRIDMNTAPPAVKKFIRALSIGADGVELTLDGDVVCRIIPPGQLTDSERTSKLKEMRQLLAQAHENSENFPSTEIETRIRGALKSVRKGR